MNKVEGKLVANGAKIGIVAARFNEFIVSKLVRSSMIVNMLTGKISLQQRISSRPSSVQEQRPATRVMTALWELLR